MPRYKILHVAEFGYMRVVRMGTIAIRDGDPRPSEKELHEHARLKWEHHPTENYELKWEPPVVYQEDIIESDCLALADFAEENESDTLGK